MITATAYANNENNQCNAKQFQPIMKLMTDMTRCWNRGDLSCVVNKFYAKKFIYVGNEIITSKEELLKHYLSAFQNKQNASLGQLKFDIINCDYIDSNNIITLQKYILTTPKEIKQGYDVLVWKKQNSQFYITLDFPKAITG